MNSVHDYKTKYIPAQPVKDKTDKVISKGNTTNRVKLFNDEHDKTNLYAIAGENITNPAIKLICIIKKFILAPWYVEVELKGQKLFLNKNSLCKRLKIDPNTLKQALVADRRFGVNLSASQCVEQALKKIDEDNKYGEYPRDENDVDPE